MLQFIWRAVCILEDVFELGFILGYRLSFSKTDMFMAQKILYLPFFSVCYVQLQSIMPHAFYLGKENTNCRHAMPSGKKKSL